MPINITMSKFILGIFLMLTLNVGANPISESIVNAFKNGNAKVLANNFNTSIDLNIPNNEGVYSKTQAAIILKTFFVKNKPTDYTTIHNGDSKNNAHYSIGKLTTSKGSFRTYILFKKEGTKNIILELRIELDE